MVKEKSVTLDPVVPDPHKISSKKHERSFSDAGSVHPYPIGIEAAHRERHCGPPRGAERETERLPPREPRLHDGLLPRGDPRGKDRERALRSSARPSGVFSARSRPRTVLKPYTFHKGEVLPVEPGTVDDKLGRRGHPPQRGQCHGSLRQRGRPDGQRQRRHHGRSSTCRSRRAASRSSTPWASRSSSPPWRRRHATAGPWPLRKAIGIPVGMACVCDGRPFTEIDALETLFDVSAIHYASGGWGGCRGLRDDHRRGAR